MCVVGANDSMCVVLGENEVFPILVLDGLVLSCFFMLVRLDVL
jgi:hypothetical protein